MRVGRGRARGARHWQFSAAAPGTVALTFDDGPAPETTLAYLAILTEESVTATFFVVGEQCERHPDILRAIVEAGMTVGLHGWSHRALAGERGSLVADELERTRAVVRAAGAEPTLWRPPYGSADRQLVRRAARLGLTTVMWNVDPRDWEDPGAEAVAARVREGMDDGALVLLHDGPGRLGTIAALRDIIDAARERGLVFADLAEHPVATR